MDDKQILILKVAEECFSTRGIKYTSIDEIVKECKMSKGTFYKYFSTKENLVYEMLKYSNERFLSQVRIIDENLEISPEKRLEQKLLLILDYRQLNYTFNSQIIGEFSEINGKTVSYIRNKLAYNLKRSYYKSLIDVYGEGIKGFIWELIFVADSALLEFAFTMRRNNEKIDKNIIIEFVFRQLRLNVENLKNHKCIIYRELFLCSELIANEDNTKSQREEFYEIIEKVKIIIKDNKKSYEAICKIEEEGRLNNYNSLTMDAMLAYLEKQVLLKDEISKLYDLRNKFGDDIVNV